MITVLGASGFVGSNLVKKLHDSNISFQAPKRGESLEGRELGHVIYCIGMTADFRTKPFETVDAHVTVLSKILQVCDFESLTYLSSTRVYIKTRSKNSSLTEADDIVINALDATDLFASSKLTGELLAMNSGRKNIKIVRLSNVFGPDLLSENFITSVVKDALLNKKVELLTTATSAKDYIAVEDVCQALIKLASLESNGIFNLSYGRNTTNDAILREIEKITGAEVSYSPLAKEIIFQEISSEKISAAVGFKPTVDIIAALPGIIAAFRSS
ncbi:MAG: NAD(P)-dependent oxidoreductase [Chitinophagaceae bacterium]|nr:MAG: NAD(P)-dependent oxidoreductase [Chitinophagaceae bacterium]